jgi:hypothetical protein
MGFLNLGLIMVTAIVPLIACKSRVDSSRSNEQTFKKGAGSNAFVDTLFDCRLTRAQKEDLIDSASFSHIKSPHKTTPNGLNDTYPGDQLDPDVYESLPFCRDNVVSVLLQPVANSALSPVAQGDLILCIVGYGPGATKKSLLGSVGAPTQKGAEMLARIETARLGAGGCTGMQTSFRMWL